MDCWAVGFGGFISGLLVAAVLFNIYLKSEKDES